MHEKIQDVMNTAWKNYKDYRRSGDMRQYTKQMSILMEKYKGDPLLLQFAENMAITYVPVINAMTEEKRNEQQIGQKEKSKVERSWMWNEIEKLGEENEWKRYFASYCVPMVYHASEIGFWVLHDKFGFGKKRLNRLMNCINSYLVSEYNKELSIRQLPLALQKMKVQVDVCAEAKKVPQRMRIKMAKMERVNNPSEFRIRVKVVTDALAIAYAMICTELVTMEKMSAPKVRQFLTECTAFINDYLDGGWVCQEDIRYQLEKETGIKVALC